LSQSVVKQTLNDRTTLAVFVIVIALTIANLCYDILVGGLYFQEMSSALGILLFIGTITASFVAGRYDLTRFVNQMMLSKRKKIKRTKMHRAINVVYYITLAILVLIAFQILTTNQYSVDLYIALAVIAFGTATIAASQIAAKFFSWYRSNKNLIVLLYAVTFALVALGIGIVVVVNSIHILTEKGGTKITPQNSQAEDSSKESRLFNYTSLPLRAAYVVYWIANVLLLRNYVGKIGKRKFWIIVSIPLVLYLATGFLISLSSATTGTALLGLGFLTVVRMLIALTATISGIFFAIIYFTVSAAMKDVKQTEIQNYLKCSAYGTMILIVTLTLPLSSLLYPPFTLVSWAFMGFGIYLLSLGFYSVATSISQDIMLRKSIRNLVISESQIFDSMGTAQMQSELQGRISKIVQQQEEEMEKHTEIKSSLTEEDMKSYLGEVIREVKTLRK